MHNLQVGDVVPVVVGAIGGASGLDGIQALADRPVAYGMEVHLEPVRIERGHVAAQLIRINVRQAVVAGLAAAGVQVRLEQASGAVLCDAVLHNLDSVRTEPARLPGIAPPAQVVELLRSPAPIPPQRAPHARGQLA